MIPRRSTRINVNNGTSHKWLCQSPETESQESPKPAQHDLGSSRRKRQKTRRTVTDIFASPAAPRFKGRRGKLQMLPEMPLDILFEIFGHLTPSDLIHLARTTKPLRHILMRRSTISIWKQAFSNDPDLPACPPDLNEPQFANLLFSRHCHFCSCSNVQDVLWAHRVRACGECLSQRFVYVNNYHGYLFPVSSLKRRSMTFSYSLASAQDDLDQEFRRIQDSGADEAQFRLERKNLVAQLQNHATMCRRWQGKLDYNRKMELRGNRVRRRDAIFAKLAELGWDDELELLKVSNGYGYADLCKHPLVKQSKDLTERRWNNIQGELVELLQTVKAKRLRREHISIVKKRMQMFDDLVKQFYSTQATTEVLPLPADFCHMEPYRTGIMDIFDKDLLTRPTFQEHFPLLSDLSAVWHLNCDQLLLSLVPSESEAATKDGLAPLLLATTFFLCQHCNNPITYPRILEHQCTSCNGSAIADEFILRCREIGSEPWDFHNNQLQFHYQASNHAKAILTACGMDPDVVTASEMDALDPRIECLHCFDERKGRLVMGWRTAISHMYSSHSEGQKTSMSRWKLVNKAGGLRTKKKEANLGTKRWADKDISCRLCRARLPGARNVNLHFNTVHKGVFPVDPTFPCRDVPIDYTSLPAVRIRK